MIRLCHVHEGSRHWLIGYWGIQIRYWSFYPSPVQLLRNSANELISSWSTNPVNGIFKCWPLLNLVNEGSRHSLISCWGIQIWNWRFIHPLLLRNSANELISSWSTNPMLLSVVLTPPQFGEWGFQTFFDKLLGNSNLKLAFYPSPPVEE